MTGMNFLWVTSIDMSNADSRQAMMQILQKGVYDADVLSSLGRSNLGYSPVLRTENLQKPQIFPTDIPRGVKYSAWNRAVPGMPPDPERGVIVEINQDSRSTYPTRILMGRHALTPREGEDHRTGFVVVYGLDCCIGGDYVVFAVMKQGDKQVIKTVGASGANGKTFQTDQGPRLVTALEPKLYVANSGNLLHLYNHMRNMPHDCRVPGQDMAYNL